MELSVYHNIIVIGANNEEICVYDYEFIKLLKIIKLEPGVNPSVFFILDVYPILIIATTDGLVYFL